MAATASEFITLVLDIQELHNRLLAHIETLDGMRGSWFYDEDVQDHIDSLQVEASDLLFPIASLVSVAAEARKVERKREAA